ncbi:hypothetical protein BSQ98_19110 [Serratia liquefaciens]|nr:hypothetical protein BSQ98_19110 [Serratia liquefaciens]
MKKIPGVSADTLKLDKTQDAVMKIKIDNEFKRLRDMGVTHGGPHAGNILVDSEVNVRIIDFGSQLYINNSI